MHIRMDWRSITFDWNRARAFLVTAEEGSFSAAARALGMSQPTLGRQVAALEEELGLTLFDRPRGGLALTEAGRDLLEHLRDMGEAARRMSLLASGQAQSVEGHVRVSASEMAAIYLLPPILRDLQKDHPGITLEIVCTDAVSDLSRREADIALRNTEPTDPDLIARKIADERGHFYATPGWLAENGTPKGPEDLARTPIIGVGDNQRLVDYMAARGHDFRVENIRLMSGSLVAHWALVLAGAGIGMASEGIAALCPQVRPAMPWMEPVEFKTWLVAHRDLLRNQRIRIVFDRLARDYPTIARSASI